MGSAFIRYGLQHAHCERIINLDLLTYAGSGKNVEEVEKDPRYHFVYGDICNESLVEALCKQEQIDAIVHFAAESHVDRSIASPKAFLKTNVFGTYALLEVVRKLPEIHFHQISTDEVFGELPAQGVFTEESPYRPNSPYSASKASADHFVRSFAHTYGLSVTTSHSTNNYGPRQFPEKFIPRMITSALDRKPLPVYGNGSNVRDWLFVDDHAQAVWMILERGRKGEVYNIGGRCEKNNLELLHLLLTEVARQSGEDPALLRKLVAFVADRPGHDFRYALDTRKIQQEINWTPQHTLEEGLRKTVEWHLKAREEVICE